MIIHIKINNVSIKRDFFIDVIVNCTIYEYIHDLHIIITVYLTRGITSDDSLFSNHLYLIVYQKIVVFTKKK